MRKLAYLLPLLQTGCTSYEWGIAAAFVLTCVVALWALITFHDKRP